MEELGVEKGQMWLRGLRLSLVMKSINWEVQESFLLFFFVI